MFYKKTTLKSCSIDRPVLEVLEARLLYSADPLTIALGAALLPGATENDTDITGDRNQLVKLDDIAKFEEIVENQSSKSQSALIEIVFVSESIKDFDTLVQEIKKSGKDNTQYVIYSIEESDSAISSISEVLSSYHELDAIHFLTHGADSSLRIGSLSISADNLEEHRTDFEAWGNSLSESGDIYLYGCNLAETDDGQSLIENLADITRADIAASTDVTGHKKYGANWALEFRSGDMKEDGEIFADGVNSWESILATVVVTTVVDLVDAPDMTSIGALIANPGIDGEISLREAIIAADVDAAHDVVLLPAGTYELGLSTGLYIGDLGINNSITIQGDGIGESIIDGKQLDRVLGFYGGTSTLDGLTIQNGKSDVGGGAILVDSANVTINSVEIKGSETSTNAGGGIYINNASMVTVNDSILEQNKAGTALPNGGAGGAIYNLSGTVVINRSVIQNNEGSDGAGIYNADQLEVSDTRFSGNTALVDGGGLFNVGTANLDRVLLDKNIAINGAGIFTTGTLNVQDSTFSANEASDDGGGLVGSSGTTTVSRSTLAYNSAGDAGGGIDWDGGTVYLQSSIVANNSAIASSGIEITTAVTSLGFNIVRNLGGLSYSFTPTDLFGTTLDPLISSSLEDNGGYTPTHTLASGSPAIDAGAGAFGVDATGVARNEITDIGSFEFRQSAELGKLFWADSFDYSINRGNSDGTAMQAILTDRPLNPFDIEVDEINGKLYWVETPISPVAGQDYGTLNWANLDGTNHQQSTQSIAHPNGLALDVAGDRIFITSDATADNDISLPNTIQQFDLAGNYVQTVVSGLPTDSEPDRMISPVDIEYEPISGDIWWVDKGYDSVPDVNNLGGVFSFNADAGNTKFISQAAPLTSPFGLAIVPSSDSVYWTRFFDFVRADINDNSTWISLEETSSRFIGIAYDKNTDSLFLSDPSGAIYTVPAFTTVGEYPFSVLFTGLSSPFGVAVATMSATDTAPSVLLNSGTSVVEGGVTVLRPSDIGVLDQDSADTDVIFHLNPINAPSNGLLVDDLGVGIGSSFTLDDLANGRVRYQHAGISETSDSFEFYLEDESGHQSSSETFTIDVYGLNDQPKILGTILDSIIEDTVNPAGETVAALFDLSFTDQDTGSYLSGIAIENNPEAALQSDPVPGHSGEWQYSVDGGASWLAVGLVGSDSALVLDTVARLRFVPVANWHGVPLALQLRGLDNTYVSGFSDGATAVTLNTDYLATDGSAFASTARTLNTLINAENDSPTTINAQLGSNFEDDFTPASNTVAELFGAGYFDIEGGLINGVAITDNTISASAGAWQYSTDGILWIDVGAVSPGNALLLSDISQIRYLPTAHYNGDPDNLQVRAVDDSYTGQFTQGILRHNLDTTVWLPSSAFSMLEYSLDTTVISVNDAPSTDHYTATVTEDTAYSFNGSEFVFFDVLDPNNIESVQILSLPPAIFGQLELSGTAVTTNQIIAYSSITQLKFIPATDQDDPVNPSFSFRVIDDGGTDFGGLDASSPKNITLDILPVNDAPAALATASMPSIAEDDATPGSETLFNLFSGSFVDVDILSSFAGVAVVNNAAVVGEGDWQYSNEGIVWSSIGAVTDSSALVLDSSAKLRFLPAGNYNGTPGQLLLRAVDNSYSGGFSLTSAPVFVDTSVNGGATPYSVASTPLTIVVTPVNDTPTTSDSSLASISEDFVNGPGDIVSGLFGASFTDTDVGDTLAGVAIVGSSSSANGQWQYSTVANDWHAVGVVDHSAALVLDGSALLRFVPASNFNGVPPALELKVMDSSYTGGFTSGVSTVTADTTLNLTTSAFSQIVNNLTTSVTSVNDAPIAADRTIDVNEDSSVGFLATDFGFSDITDGDTLKAILVENILVSGNLSLGGTLVSNAQTIAVADFPQLKYTPLSNDDLGLIDTFDFKVIDTGGILNGGVDTSANSQTIGFNLVPVNDAPDIGNATLPTIYEDDINPPGKTIENLFSASFADVDSNSTFSGLALVENSAINTEGQWEYSSDGINWFAMQLANEANALILGKLSSIRFVPEPDYNGTPGSLSFRAMDNSYNGTFTVAGNHSSADVSTNGGSTPFSSGVAELSVSVRSVNDLPAIANAILPAIAEDSVDPPGATVVALFGSSYNDLDSSSGIAAVAITENQVVAAGQWQYSTNGADWHDVGAVSESTALIVGDTASLRFMPESNFNGTPPDLRVRVFDNTYSGGFSAAALRVTVDTTTSIAAMSLGLETNSLSTQILPVSDAPEGINATVTINEDGHYVFSPSDFAMFDVDADDSLAAVEINYLPVKGTLAVSGLSVTAGYRIPLSELAAGALVYQPSSNENGSAYASFGFSVIDSSGAANAQDKDQTPAILTIDVLPVDDAPDAIRVSNFFVDENDDGAIIGSVSVDDNDIGDSHTISVDDSRFEVDEGELKIVDGVSLDYETEPRITLVLSATDASGLNHDQSIILQLANVNEFPVVSNEINQVTVSTPYVFTFPIDTFTDEDNDALAYMASQADGSALPEWVVFYSETQSFEITEPIEGETSISVIVTAYDGNGGSAEIEMDIFLIPELASALPEEVMPITDETETEELDVESQSLTETTSSAEPEPTLMDIPEPEPESESEPEPELFVEPNPVPLAIPEVPEFSPTTFDQFQRGETETSFNSRTNQPYEFTPIDILRGSDDISLAKLFELSDAGLNSTFANLVQHLDQGRNMLTESSKFSHRTVATSVTLSSGLSVGYILWLIRGGTLVGSVLSALPAWRFIDPLPVLGTLEGSAEDDGESLESMVEDRSMTEGKSIVETNVESTDQKSILEERFRNGQSGE